MLEKLEEVNPNITEIFKFEEEKEVHSDNHIKTKNNILSINPPSRSYSIIEDLKIEDMINEQLVIQDINEDGSPLATTQLHITNDVLCIQLARTTITNQKDMYKTDIKSDQHQRNRIQT